MNVALFDQIQGHRFIKETLLQAMEHQRLAHALLFSGPSGVGKKTMALALAQKLLCDKKLGCGRCQACLNVAKQQSEYMLFIATDQLTLRLDDVRRIHSFLAFSTDKAKIVIIDAAEKLHLKAANSLLKIIEEPPINSFFFLISSKISQLPITIRSRLQVFRFQPLSLEILKNLVTAEDWIMAACQGRLDRIEELQDQKELRQLAVDLWKTVFQKTVLVPALKFPPEIYKRKEALVVCEYWIQMLRDARFLSVGEHQRLIHKDQILILQKMAQLDVQTLDHFIQKALELEKNLRLNLNSVLCFENFVITLQKRI